MAIVYTAFMCRCASPHGSQRGFNLHLLAIRLLDCNISEPSSNRLLYEGAGYSCPVGLAKGYRRPSRILRMGEVCLFVVAWFQRSHHVVIFMDEAMVVEHEHYVQKSIVRFNEHFFVLAEPDHILDFSGFQRLYTSPNSLENLETNVVHVYWVISPTTLILGPPNLDCSTRKVCEKMLQW
jgi:hypothetical protein